MYNPYKIIYKVKNNNREYQYYLYIFLGYNLDDRIKLILKKIQNIDLYNSFIKLNLNEYKYIEKYYGIKWYYKFFMTNTIKKTLNNILKNKTQYNELLNKYGEKWIMEHIKIDFKKNTKVMYNFNDNFKFLYEKKNKITKLMESDIDYDKNTNLVGGFEEENNNEDNNKEDEEDVDVDVDNLLDQTKNLTLLSESEKSQIDDNDEFDIDELDIMNKNIEEKDQELNKNIKLVNKILEVNNDSNINLEPFDTSKDDIQYEDDILNNYNKIYIYNQYIYEDDTIINIKKKITCSISLNNKFSKEKKYIPILPSRQYLYSKYDYIDPKTKELKTDSVMIGQKWIKRNIILKISNVPNKNIRYYENLSGNLILLKEDIKKYGNRIKREDDSFNTIEYYDNYIMNNEIYLLDIYNELGLDYNTTNENLDNLYDVYLRIYYFNLAKEDLNNIISFINNKNNNEFDFINNIFLNYNNSLLLDNEIMKTVNNLVLQEKYNDYGKKNNITQTTIHLNIYNELNNKNNIDIFRIFDNFVVSDIYPFVIFQSFDGKLNYKFIPNSNVDRELIKKKWFDTAPYGISFKIKVPNIDDKYISVNLNEYGRIEYKNQFKEINKVELDDIKFTYIYVKNLIKKINSESLAIKLNIPKDEDFKFAFINSIQNFVLPKKAKINHNYLSDLVRYFYPYFSLVIEPKKRLAKIIKEDSKSKYGTYLRYKRIDKFENESKLEYRIINFMRNYEYDTNSLAQVISKQFNITNTESLKKINEIKSKYPKLKKSRKILKSLDNIPKYKPPGIGVDIQGKDVELYKIRISGARDKKQLNRISQITNIIIYIYVEIYINKNKNFLFIKNKLNLFENIARRLNKVEDIVITENKIENVKKMIKMDKERIGFKPEKGQNQWTRSCQNSGNDKKRRPDQYDDSNISKMFKEGYKLNKKTNFYEKQIKIKNKMVTIRAVKLSNYDGKGNNIYYTCDPKVNKEHMYIGFLSRSSNPYGHCMPCCFKKDQLISKNQEKKNYFLECINDKKKQIISTKKDNKNTSLDKLYILQDTNKIHEGRYGYLPKILDIFLNITQNNTVDIKNHYLINTSTGYFFKYGSNQLNNNFMNAFTSLFDISLEEIINKLIDKLKKDSNLILFTSLNNGNIRYVFKNIDNYINYLKNSNNINFKYIIDILSTNNIITSEGLNIIIFDQIEKNIIVDNKEKLAIDYTIYFNNRENEFLLENPKLNTILFIKDNNNFYPIKFVKFNNKKIVIENTFKYVDNKDNIIKRIVDFYKLNNLSYDIIFKYTNNEYISKNIYNKLFNNDKIKPKFQLIDTMFKCIYFILNNNSIILIENPSGIISTIPIINDLKKYVMNLPDTIKNYLYINKMIDINFIPKYLYYKSYNKNSYNIIGISIFNQSTNIVPIKEINITDKQLQSINNKFNINLQLKKLLFNKQIDNFILNKEKDIIDDRIVNYNTKSYIIESYNIFKLEISNYLNLNYDKKEKIIQIYDSKSSEDKKIIELKKIFFNIVFKNLYDTTVNLNEISKFKLSNYRYICNNLKDKNTCNNNIFCNYNNGKCKPTLKKSELYNHINRLTNEIIYNNLIYKEVLNIDNYYVNDIIDKNNFVERENQIILKSSNIVNINTILKNIYSIGEIPKLGKKKKIVEQDEEIEKIELEKFNKYYLQTILPNSNTLYRSFSNSLYWLKNELYDIEFRNLGYFNDIQSKLANYFKGNVINWILDVNNKDIILSKLKKYFGIENYNEINNLVLNIPNTDKNLTNHLGILFILNNIIKIPIIIYNYNIDIINIIDNNIFTNDNNIDLKKYKNNNKYINLLFEFNENNIPTKIKSVYFI